MKLAQGEPRVCDDYNPNCREAFAKLALAQAEPVCDDYNPNCRAPFMKLAQKDDKIKPFICDDYDPPCRSPHTHPNLAER